ncbi:MAG: F0F1 ATP synthase subunit B [Candidatus Azosocius agrarius]|nr:MAG: F0F1 ATP synthase subunit B [Gammaproteobacteria bacterium]
MNINATLLGQMITFAVFVWFTMKFVWPMINEILLERQKKIGEGLAAAESGHKILSEAKKESVVKINSAKRQGEDIIANANHLASQIIDEAKELALKEKEAIIASGHLQINRELQQAKIDLQNDLADLVIRGVEKVLSRAINPNDHRELLNKLSQKL